MTTKISEAHTDKTLPNFLAQGGFYRFVQKCNHIFPRFVFLGHQRSSTSPFKNSDVKSVFFITAFSETLPSPPNLLRSGYISLLYMQLRHTQAKPAS